LSSFIIGHQNDLAIQLIHQRWINNGILPW